ncbi:hypothetical protein SESBI_13582 [Sesbania bispinosa]|nr:hypothetical protein SESBI_13582 [Sesbania bispinosa]
MQKQNPAERGGIERFVVIQVSSTDEDQIRKRRPKLNLSVMKLFHRFRKIVMRFILLVPSRGSRQRNSDRFEPPKTSCSSYYSSYSHYNEAIADCIEFFNKSAQDGINLDARKSDVV